MNFLRRLANNNFAAIALPIIFVTSAGHSSAQDADPYAKKIKGPSQEGQKAIARMQTAGKLKIDLWAAEPLLANPVSFCFDEKGRIYVTETFRLGVGTPDNRGHMYWIDDEVASRSVEDRLAMYEKHLGKKVAAWEKEQDRVRMLEDTKGEGKADKSTIFAGGFQTALTGLGAGVLARGGKVYYTCIPDLWLLQDTKGTGQADVKKSLHHGFGVHVSFVGHDLHGLRMGPDGRIYFTMGDRGLFVKTEGRTLAVQDTGSVLRCNPDGSELEIFATGLRNPQKIAFDEHGNLFTCDNNADGGDAARWVYVVEGGDSGWRMGYQQLPGLGPWNAEKLWHTAETNTAAYLLPPLKHFATGPSGLTYFPGTGLLPEKYKDHFFLCDFRGGPGMSGIWSFKNKAKGASFELTNPEKFIWSILPTDCEFGPDGGFYWSDWVDGWGMPFKGRIYKAYDESLAGNAQVADVKLLLAEGFSERRVNELGKLLGHADQRVRQEAQFALAERTGQLATVMAELRSVLTAQSSSRLQRLHAIWALGQINRRHKDGPPRTTLDLLFQQLKNADPEVCAQAARTLGDWRVGFTPEKGSESDKNWKEATERLVPLLGESSPRVRFFAAQTLGKIGRGQVREPIIKMLADNADKDLYLRHAGVMAMAGNFDHAALLEAAKHPSASVRMAAALAMRRTGDPDIKVFLNDNDPKIVLEAARAIADTSLSEAYAELAAVLQRPASTMKDWPASVTDPLFQRAAAAAFRLASPEQAQALAQFAGRGDVSNKVRLEALKHLGDWAKPPVRDRFDGLVRVKSPPARILEQVAQALRPVLAAIMTAPDPVRTEGVKLAAKYGIKEIAPVLRALVGDTSRPAAVRVETFLALEKLKDDELLNLAEQALKDDEPRLRHQARRLLLQKQSPAEAVTMLAGVADRGATFERQGAFGLLAGLKGAEADAVLAKWVDQLLDKKAPPEIQLDILEAASLRGGDNPDLAGRLRKFEAARAKSDHLAAYRETLFGGDAEAGKKIFFDRSELACLRCHKVNGVGGSVGPDLTGIGKKQTREYLLESIVDPNRQIAKGYDTVVLTLLNGQVKSGILRHEDKKEVHLMTPEGQTIIVALDQIDERSRGRSAMPDDLMKHMSRSDLRNLIEYLAGL